MEHKADGATRHQDPDELWRAYSALCGLAQYTAFGEHHRDHLRPAMNVILHALRAQGQICGLDYPE